MNEKLTTAEISAAHGLSRRQARRIAASGDWRSFRRTRDEPETKAEIYRRLMVEHIRDAAKLRQATVSAWESQRRLIVFITENLDEKEIVALLGPTAGRHVGAAVAVLKKVVEAVDGHLCELAAADKILKLTGCSYSSVSNEPDPGQ